MAEPVTLPLTGAGDVTTLVAVDDSGATGVVQLFKLAISANGSAVLVPADAKGLFVQTVTRTELPQDDLLVATALTAGSSIDLDASIITAGRTGKLVAADIGASVPIRCDIQTVSGPRITRTSVYTVAGRSTLWRPPAPSFIEQVGGGTNKFGVAVTNLSPSATADARITLYWDEVL